MSLFTGTTHSEKLAAIFGLSSYLPLSNKINEFMPQDWPNKQTPVFMAHGDADGVVKFEFGQKSADHLREMGMPIEFHKYKLVYRFLFSICISSSCILFFSFSFAYTALLDMPANFRLAGVWTTARTRRRSRTLKNS